jgi:hypothetical protein
MVVSEGVIDRLARLNARIDCRSLSLDESDMEAAALVSRMRIGDEVRNENSIQSRTEAAAGWKREHRGGCGVVLMHQPWSRCVRKKAIRDEERHDQGPTDDCERTAKTKNDPT